MCYEFQVLFYCQVAGHPPVGLRKVCLVQEGCHCGNITVVYIDPCRDEVFERDCEQCSWELQNLPRPFVPTIEEEGEEEGPADRDPEDLALEAHERDTAADSEQVLADHCREFFDTHLQRLRDEGFPFVDQLPDPTSGIQRLPGFYTEASHGDNMAMLEEQMANYSPYLPCHQAHQQLQHALQADQPMVLSQGELQPSHLMSLPQLLPCAGLQCAGHDHGSFQFPQGANGQPGVTVQQNVYITNNVIVEAKDGQALRPPFTPCF